LEVRPPDSKFIPSGDSARSAPVRASAKQPLRYHYKLGGGTSELLY